jgi:hypothetical protein
VPRVVVNPRSHALFVRGTDKELELVEDLIKVLDIEPGQEIPSSSGYTIVRLKHAKIDDVLQVLNGLGLQGQVIPLTRMNALILPKAERQANDVRMVIENVDIEGKPKPKEKTSTATSAKK